jgi:hypothetical protein
MRATQKRGSVSGTVPTAALLRRPSLAGSPLGTTQRRAEPSASWDTVSAGSLGARQVHVGCVTAPHVPRQTGKTTLRNLRNGVDCLS